MTLKTFHIIVFSVLVSVNSCKKKTGAINSPVDPPPTSSDVSVWITKDDQSSLLQKRAVATYLW